MVLAQSLAIVLAGVDIRRLLWFVNDSLGANRTGASRHLYCDAALRAAERQAVRQCARRRDCPLYRRPV